MIFPNLSVIDHVSVLRRRFLTSLLLFLAEFLESWIGAQRIPDRISGRALTGHDEIVEKDRGSRWLDHRRSNDRCNGGIRARAQSREGTRNENYRLPEALNARSRNQTAQGSLLVTSIQMQV